MTTPPPAPLVVCAWCQATPPGVSVTHTICAGCLEKELAEIRRIDGQANVADPKPGGSDGD